jgi:hypothetical protein
MSFFVGLLYATLLLKHVSDMKYSYSELCAGLFPTPCFLYYSRFDASSDQYYALTLILFMILGIVISVYKWVEFDLVRKKRELYDDKKKKFSRLFFNSLDWSTPVNNYEGRQMASSIRLEIKINLDEERIKAEIEKRTNLEKSALFIRRTITLFLNTLILLAGWVGIILINYYDKDIQSSLKNVNVIKYVSAFVPSISLTIINAIVPKATVFFTAFEKWDF